MRSWSSCQHLIFYDTKKVRTFLYHKTLRRDAHCILICFQQDDKPGYVVERSSIQSQRCRQARATYLKRDGPPHCFYSVLLRMGFTWPLLLPTGRQSLTLPFHPYVSTADAVYLCCTGLGVASTGRYPASCPVKPGLSSPASFRNLQPRPSVLLEHCLLFYHG